MKKVDWYLSEMSSKLLISDKQIQLSGLKMNTRDSEIDIPLFELNYNQWSAFRSFEDSVVFNSILNDSRVALSEVSYFVPSMEGMSDTLKLKGKVLNSVNNLEVHNLELFFGNKSIVNKVFFSSLIFLRLQMKWLPNTLVKHI